MADRPIIFSASTVRALLAGRKSQTRRVLKPQPDPGQFFGSMTYVEAQSLLICRNATGMRQAIRVPYAPRDRLWVKEAHAFDIEANTVDEREIIWYRATQPVDEVHWRSPIHMPRRASRLTLLVTDVRVQRLQEISEDDARAEGVLPDGFGGYRGHEGTIGYPTAIWAFRHICHSIHGPGAWDANPWVAAISFTVHRCNIDTMEEGTW